MPGLIKNATGDQPPFGHKNFLYSTTYTPPESRTVSSAAHPVEPGLSDNQKMLHPGETMAKITSGPNQGKIGVYSTDTTGVTDGRSDLANIVGLNGDFWPYQLMDRDVETAVFYNCTARQLWCTVRDENNARVAMTNTVADAMRDRKDLFILFK